MNYHSEKNRTKHEKDKLNIYSIDNLLSFTSKVNNNNHEPFNIVAENGDSITASSKGSGEEYVSLSLVIDLVKEIVQQELVAAGVIRKK